MNLTIHLTDTEYHGVMQALKHATRDQLQHLDGTDQLELLHLMTLLAQATTKEEQ